MNEQAIFLAAFEILDPAERQAYVLRACSGDERLRRQVESLLTAHGQSGEFLDVPALEQIGAGEKMVATRERRRAPDDTEANSNAVKPGDRAIDFLEPSPKPGVLGQLGHYEVLEVLGQGGFGTVVKAFDEKLHRMVAIKIMSPQLAVTSPARKRFIREARSSAAVRHENVVNIHAIEEQPIPFLVMEYVVGETLQQRLDRIGPLDAADVLSIGVQIAHGLAAAHAMGKIHCDIKPANILLENGINHVKITDFGLARAADDASLTQSGVIAGTPMYMAPEQAQGLAIDHRADLFSFGSVLYVMCSGRPPFRGPTTLAVLNRVTEDTPRPLREIIPELPDWLCAIITKLHAKKPEDRFGSAREVADLLERYLAEMQQSGVRGQETEIRSQESGVRSQPAAKGLPPRRRKHIWVAAAAALAVLALVGLGLTEATNVTDLRGTVIRLFSAEGTLIVEVDDPDVSVTIDGEDIVIKGAGAKEIRIKPGKYKLQASKDGKIVRQELITVTNGGRQFVRISREIAPPLLPGDPDRRAAEYVLSIGGAIWIMWNGKERQPAAVSELPRDAFELTDVSLFDNTKVSDAGLANFKDCKSVASLNLNDNPKVSDAGLAHFQDCKNFTGLHLNETQVSDAGLAHFKDCKDLTHLDLCCNKVGDAGLAHFKDCKNLTALDLNETQMSDVGLAHFKDCKNLIRLNLYGTRVTDAALAQMAGYPQLVFVLVKNTQVTERSVRTLAAALPKCRIEYDGGVIGPR